VSDHIPFRVQPTLVREPFDRPGWVFEEKYDGDRILAYKEGSSISDFSRSSESKRRLPIRRARKTPPSWLPAWSLKSLTKSCPTNRPGRYWDGAMSGCNNPVLAAVTEAIMKSQNSTNIAVLSTGTASVARPWPQQGQPVSPYVQQIVDPGLVTGSTLSRTSSANDFRGTR
jgi:hypothetical protein